MMGFATLYPSYIAGFDIPRLAIRSSPANVCEIGGLFNRPVFPSTSQCFSDSFASPGADAGIGAGVGAGCWFAASASLRVAAFLFSR